jgi:hypothetical protein
MVCCFFAGIAGTVMGFAVVRRNDVERVDHGRALGIAAIGVGAFQLGSAVVVGVFVLGSGVLSLDSGQYAGDAANADANRADISDLTPGSCLTDASLRGRHGHVRAAGCREPHDGEVASLIPLPGDDYPGLAGFRAQARRECPKAAAAYLGGPLADSGLSVTFYYPNRAAWTDRSARAISCVVWSPHGRLRKPVKDSLH